ncbi:MAG: tetratricopeptide repeat protein, partial [bacterium]
RNKIILGLFIIFCLSLPLILLINYFQNRPKFPLSTINLPTGITAFLKNLPITGSLLNHPNNGGYLIWELYPQYKIFMDMEVPFLFTDEDFFMAANAFSDEEVLRKIIAKYSPSFISAPQTQKDFKNLIKKFPNFVPIFFDQAEVLYINQKTHPEIASKFKLQIDPFDLFGKKIEDMLNLKGKDILLDEILRLNKIYPECLLTNQILSMFYNKEGDYHSSIKYADRIIDNYPDAPIGYKLKGIALKNLKSYGEALSCFEKALKRTSGDDKREIYKQMAYSYTQKQDYKRAYKFFKKGIHIFSSKTTYQELFDFSSAALLSDRIDEAIFYLKLASKKVPPEDKKYKERIESQLGRLGILEEEW